MPEVTINYWAVLAAGVSSMVLGWLWYGALFGKAWMKMSGLTKEKLDEQKKKGMAKSYILAFVGSLMMAYVLAHMVDYTQSTTAKMAAQAGFWLWLGFVGPTTLESVLWEGKSWKLWFFNAAHGLLTLVVMAIILVKWV